MNASAIERRLKVVEDAIADLKRRIEAPPSTSRHWLQEIAGSMKDYPEFEEVVQLGAKIRRADRPGRKKV
jgi:hypothetical protein